jgi:hypothetical protein
VARCYTHRRSEAIEFGGLDAFKTRDFFLKLRQRRLLA